METELTEDELLAPFRTLLAFKQMALDSACAELAELKARKCETCRFWKNVEVQRVTLCRNASIDVIDPKADFACNQWQGK